MSIVSVVGNALFLAGGIFLIVFSGAFARTAVRQHLALTGVRRNERPFRIGAVLGGLAWVVMSLLSIVGVL